MARHSHNGQMSISKQLQGDELKVCLNDMFWNMNPIKVSQIKVSTIQIQNNIFDNKEQVDEEQQECCHDQVGLIGMQ